MTSTDYSKYIGLVKDFPVWALTAIAFALAIIQLNPDINNQLPHEYKPWNLIFFIVFLFLAIFKWIAILINAWKNRNAKILAKKKFHASTINNKCHWNIAQQSDGSFVTQIHIGLNIKNQSTAPITLISLRIIKPLLKGEVIKSMILVLDNNNSVSETHAPIAVGALAFANADAMIRGKPDQNEEENLVVLFGITDDDGNEQLINAECKGMKKQKPISKPIPLEKIHLINNPIEKNIASVLHNEINRYEVNGRISGGLGSFSIMVNGKDLKNSSTFRELKNSKEQEIKFSVSASIKSDNFRALLKLYSQQVHSEQKIIFVNALLNRLQPEMGYTCVSYFIVLTLTAIGQLGRALERAELELPKNDNSSYGLSNVYLMLERLLTYQHQCFTSEMLDTIERIVHSTEEHTFRIPQKIAAIRSNRLILPELNEIKNF